MLDEADESDERVKFVEVATGAMVVNVSVGSSEAEISNQTSLNTLEHAFTTVCKTIDLAENALKKTETRARTNVYAFTFWGCPGSRLQFC